MPASGHSPFTKPVIFLICLAIALLVLSGVVFFSLDHTAEEPEKAPLNGPAGSSSCEIFRTDCPGGCGGDQACLGRCDKLYNGCEYQE